MSTDTNEQLTLTLTYDERKAVMTSYITRSMLPETNEVFNEALAEGKSLDEAAADAVFNEAVNVLLREEKDRQLAITTPKRSPSKMIWVTFRKEGIHMYPAAATDPKLKTGDWDDVSFLAVPHRHIFHFRVAMEVFHDNRDVEFIQFKRWLERLYEQGTLELNHKSCEMISDDLHAKIAERFPCRAISIEVSEDGENGSITGYPA